MKTDTNETLLSALQESLSYMTGLTLSPSWQRQGAIDSARFAIAQVEPETDIEYKIQYDGLRGWYDLRENTGDDDYVCCAYSSIAEARDELDDLKELNTEDSRIVHVNSNPEDWSPYE